MVETARIVEVTPGPYLPVWDISVEDDHTFIASGVVVHNCDEMKLELLDAALGQPMVKMSRALGRPLAANTLMASTQQYWDKTMSEVIKRATVEHRYKFYEHCWRETVACAQNPDGWLDSSEVREKYAGITESIWKAEYEGQEPNPESRAIMPDRVASMFRKELGEVVGEQGECIFEEPDPLGTYATGADWAKVRDATVIVTMRTDCMPWRIVGYRRTQRQSYPVMVGYLDGRLERFPGRSAHDKTGVGVAVDDLIKYRDPKPEGVTLVGAERAQVFDMYINAVEKGQIVGPMIHQMEKEHRLCSRDDLAGSGHPPDSFVAAALAFRAGSRRKLAFATA